MLVTHIDRLSRGLTYGLQVIEDLQLRGVEFRSLSEDFDTSTATGKLQLAMEGRFPSKGEHLAGKHSCEGEVLPGEPVESPASRTARITRHG